MKDFMAVALYILVNASCVVCRCAGRSLQGTLRLS